MRVISTYSDAILKNLWFYWLSRREVTHAVHQYLRCLLPGSPGIFMSLSNQHALQHNLLTPRPKYMLSGDLLHPMTKVFTAYFTPPPP